MSPHTATHPVVSDGGRVRTADGARASRRVSAPIVGPLGSEAAFVREVLRGIFGESAEALLGRTGDEAPARVRLAAGDTLFLRGEDADSMYALVYGRLESWVEDAGGRETVVGRVAPGETVGEMAMLTSDSRPTSVRATRESVLVRIPAAAFRAVSRSDPALMGTILRLVAGRLDRSHDARPRPARSTVTALIPLSAAIARAGFGERLAAELATLGTVARREAATFPLLASGAIERFGRLEGEHDFVLLDCPFFDLATTAWAVRHADRIVLYADAAADPRPDAYERRVLEAAARPGAPSAVDVTLALIHPAGTVAPRGTRRWLEGRAVGRHLHLRDGDRGDLARLARTIAGRSIALVLSGGGARGYAHIGVARAFEEIGVPVDAVCGTSMGALVGAGFALGMPSAEMLRTATTLNARKPFGDYTLPFLSVVRGERLSRILRAAIGDGDIEDCWRPFFCVSSSLTSADVFVHRTGPLWRAIRASMSLPGIFPPVIVDGEVLIDGGIVNNLPIDVLTRDASALTIAVSASVRPRHAAQGESFPSGWRWAWERWVRRRPGPPAPSVMDVVSQATTLASFRKQVQDAASADLLLRPDVARWSMMDLVQCPHIAEAGYRCTMEHAEALRSLVARSRGRASSHQAASA